MNYKDKYILFYLEGKKALSEKRVSRILGISSPDDMPDGYHGQDTRIWVYINFHLRYFNGGEKIRCN